MAELIAWLPDFIVAPMLADGRLERVLDDHCQSESPIQLVMTEGRFRPLKVRLFAEQIEHLLQAG